MFSSMFELYYHLWGILIMNLYNFISIDGYSNDRVRFKYRHDITEILLKVALNPINLDSNTIIICGALTS